MIAPPTPPRPPLRLPSSRWTSGEQTARAYRTVCAFEISRRPWPRTSLGHHQNDADFRPVAVDDHSWQRCRGRRGAFCANLSQTQPSHRRICFVLPESSSFPSRVPQANDVRGQGTLCIFAYDHFSLYALTCTP